MALAAFFFAAGKASADGPPAGSIAVACRLEPEVLDVGRPAGPLTARLEVFAGNGLVGLDPRELSPGVYVSSVAGRPLAAPSSDTEGIEEDPTKRSFEDGQDARGRSPLPNGVPEAVVRFARPSDGDPRTARDGDAGDVLAMVMDVPDGTSVEVCLAGSFRGAAFACCDQLRVRNRGLRPVPRGLIPVQAETRR